MEIVAASEWIFYIRELISKDLCGTIVENFKRDPSKRSGQTVGSQGEKKSHDEVRSARISR